jgi:hypothetical protein
MFFIYAYMIYPNFFRNVTIAKTRPRCIWRLKMNLPLNATIISSTAKCSGGLQHLGYESLNL